MIVGVAKVEQVEANIKAGEWQLTPDDVAEVNKVLEGADSQ